MEMDRVRAIEVEGATKSTPPAVSKEKNDSSRQPVSVQDVELLTPSKDSKIASKLEAFFENTAEGAERQETPQEMLNDLGDSVNSDLRGSDVRLEFAVDADSQKVIVKVIDNRTDNVIRQLPPEQAIKQAKKGALVEHQIDGLF